MIFFTQSVGSYKIFCYLYRVTGFILIQIMYCHIELLVHDDAVYMDTVIFGFDYIPLNVFAFLQADTQLVRCRYVLKIRGQIGIFYAITLCIHIQIAVVVTLI